MTHVGYCTNIHPGESWDEVRANLERHVLRVKAMVAPDRPFGVGLRLSGRAAVELEPEVDRFRAWLDAHGLYVFTINGFPHGRFHGAPVKEDVYRPDWLEDERVAYSDRLARILARLLPDGVDGTISTVPGRFRTRRGDVAERIARHVRTLEEIRAATGKRIALALEPEPACLLETTADGARFFAEELAGLPRAHVGLCLDACHAAVEFETVDAILRTDVPIHKIQLSCGLRVVDHHDALERFADAVYLHQVVTASGAKFDDLPQALAEAKREEWRVHFHVPIFREALGPFASTRPFLEELLAAQRKQAIAPHLEVETYTWDVLPEEHRGEDVAIAVARELRFVLERIG